MAELWVGLNGCKCWKDVHEERDCFGRKACALCAERSEGTDKHGKR